MGGSLDIITSSITESTLKQYECSLKRWWEYAHSFDMDIFNSKTIDIIKFLTKLFEEGASYSSLNTARSAISLISVCNINKDGMIPRFLKGTFKQRPAKPKYDSTWDVTPVLNFIEKLHSNDWELKIMCQRLATLLILTTAQRLQTLALINIDNIQKSDKNIRIKITEQIKTSKPGTFHPELVLPFFKDRPGLCVASAVLDYVKHTHDLRNENTRNLFITSIKPYRAVTSQTIGHWIKSLLSRAGINMTQFTAYSAKHAAESAAYKNGVDITTIRRSAGWASGSNTFFKFYNRPIQEIVDDFALKVLQKGKKKKKKKKN